MTLGSEGNRGSTKKLACELVLNSFEYGYSKTCVKRPLSNRSKICFQDQLLLNAGRKFCRMLQREHSAIAILSTFIKLPFVIKIFALSNLSGRFTQILLYIGIFDYVYKLS